MSWAEIKKAINSNLDVPLDKIIAPNGKIVTNRNIISSNTPSAMVEVNSPALIYVLNVYSTLYSSETSKILKCTTNVKITIDGEIYDNVKLTAQESNTRQYYQSIANSYAIAALPTRLVLAMSNIITSGWFGSSPTVYTSQYNGLKEMSYSTGPYNDNISPTERIISDGNTSYVYIPTITPLIAKKGFKVECSGNYDETTATNMTKGLGYNILYTLLG